MNKQSFVITVLTACVSLTVTAQGAKDAEGTKRHKGQILDS
jgi:hypothetical protein